MSKLNEALADFCLRTGLHSPQMAMSADRAFMEGAAAMAEICAGGTAAIVEELKEIRQAMVRNRGSEAI